MGTKKSPPASASDFHLKPQGKACTDAESETGDTEDRPPNIPQLSVGHCYPALLNCRRLSPSEYALRQQKGRTGISQPSGAMKQQSRETLTAAAQGFIA
ncbi:hypothetical protein BFJ71_g2521 [Fusarium oxysporum]|nr:hypothetical protein BFJ71_g2521 [Fusarium oxysporum]